MELCTWKSKPSGLTFESCSVNTLITRRWWEGPAWLTEEEELWPISNLYPDKNVVNAEKKKISCHFPVCEESLRFSGKDGVTRLVKVKTASGEKLRPVQRLYSLEINAVSSEPLRHRALKGTRRLSQSTEKKNLRNKIADSVKSKVDNPPVLNQKTRLRREIKTVKRLDL
ncbi:hypothetical protein CEXT_440851 [Caerostris extrusa]|uniref:Uncharacterized protein n=1 Tax=Caerostris extrusa TaxID=172846 RepID=A0AAV4R3Y7_CAEEX|nr:hypothetical protein CEXT_440851 [Caerostris extrusa]